jgi:hypothetical protein
MKEIGAIERRSSNEQANWPTMGTKQLRHGDGRKDGG